MPGFNIILLGDIEGLSFGLVIKNIGPQMSFGGSGLLVQASPTGSTSDPTNSFNRNPSYYSINAASFDLPSSFELGFGYKPTIDDLNSLQISANYQNNNFFGDLYDLGGEYSYNKTFFLRSGYAYSPKGQDPNYIYGFTAGAGIAYNLGSIDLMVDYAYRDIKFFKANHIFAVTLGF